MQVVTNGYGPVVNRVIATLPKELKIVNTLKKDTSGNNAHSPHIPFYIAPVDVAEYRNTDYANACRISSCGIGLTKYGYYQCPIGGAIDRVFGFNIGRKTMPLPEDSMTDQMNMLCRYCGHFISDQDYNS